MELKIEDQEGVCFLIPEGELVTGEADKLLESEFLRLVHQGHHRLVVDLGKVTYIDSSVLGKLVYGHTLFRNQGGELRLLNPPKRVRDLLEVTRLSQIFQVYEDATEATQGWRDQ